jgi:uncharacterized membrane protein
MAMKLPLSIILFLLGLAIAQSLYFYPLLPDTVSSHFDSVGKVNGTAAKLSYFILYLALLALTSSFTLGLPLILKYLPTDLINLPHREYWLSDDQREGSLSFLSSHFAWFGVAITAVVIAFFYLTFLANITPTKDLNITIFWALLGALFLFIIWWTIVLLRRFLAPS